jgi:hypothetical protein
MGVIRFFLPFPAKNPVVNVRKNIVPPFQGGKPFGADIITAQCFINRGKIAEVRFDAVPRDRKSVV